MSEIDPLPDMTKEEALAFLCAIRNTKGTFSFVLAKYIERHRADLTTTPLERLAGEIGIPQLFLKSPDIFPDLPVLIALASIAVHVDEFTTPGQGHPFDLEAIKSLLSDPALKSWMKKMDSMAFLPKKRK